VKITLAYNRKKYFSVGPRLGHVLTLELKNFRTELITFFKVAK
jgi:hypothetical protein